MELMKKATVRKYIVNSDVFLREDDVSFYLLGAYMTDGNINDTKHHVSFSIISKDRDWIENIRDIICPNKPLYDRLNCCAIEVSDIDAMSWLISYGCTPRKSKTLLLEKTIPEKYHRDFIRGLIDGDGSITSCPYKKVKNNKEYWYTKRTIYLCSASKIFIEQISSLIPSNISCHIITLSPKNSIIRGKEVIATCNQYRLQFNDSNAQKLLTWLYYPEHKLSMPRKNQLALSLI